MAQISHRPFNLAQEYLPQQVLESISYLRRSVLLMIAMFGVILMLVSAFVLPQLGLQTTAGLLTISGFNVMMIGLVGYVIYKFLEKRY